MKKILTLIAAVAIGAIAFAQVNITKVDKVAPTDEIFMDMAVTAAQQAIASGQKAAGAVVILNVAWKATGTPSATATAEENAITKSRRTNLAGASIYTVNQPTTAALNAIMKAGVDVVFFVNPSSDAVAAGVYPAEAYDPAGLDTTLTPVPVMQLHYAPATQLLKK